MKFENEQHLGGKLVGIGKIRTDGTMEHRFLDNPIKNKIVSTGLDHMLRYNGDNEGYYSSNSAVKLFTGATSNHYGVLNYCSFGSSLESTSFFDEGLKAEIGTKASTKVSGEGLCGTKINAFGNYSFRVTHKHNAVSETTTVNEIAWFGRYGSSSYIYPMFSRVVLDSPIVLSAGEQLITTYQLDMQFSGAQEESISFFGLTDTNGQPLKAQKKLVNQQSIGSTEWEAVLGMPYLKKDGTANANSNHVYWAFPATLPANSNYYAGGIFYGTKGFALPTEGSSVSQAASAPGSSGEGSSYYGLYTSNVSEGAYNRGTPLPYNGVGRTTKYRDKQVVFGAYTPYMNNSSGYKDITNLLINGYAYRFGYYDDGGNWQQQAFRKYANQELSLIFRCRYTTEDTTSEE